MKEEKAKQILQEFFAPADIKIDGSRVWDIKVHNPKMYSRVLARGSLALGESYMDGWWDCERLDEFFYRIVKTKSYRKINSVPSFLVALKSILVNRQNRSGVKKVAEEHYNLSSDLYMSFLDPYNQYTCGYFKDTDDLDKAQEQKMDLICKKLDLKPKMKILDIGCGWGGFAKFAAQKYGCHVTGITISDEQVRYAQELCKGLPVEIKLQDYRDIEDKFDHIISIGMFEHVGHKNYKTFMKVVNRCLKDDGLFLLHTIGGNITTSFTDPWVDKYIFPNGILPSAKQISASVEHLFVIEDWHNFGADYSKTLMAWHKNFTKNWNKIKKDYDERFYRMWNYYLLCYAGSFRARHNQLWQIVFSKKGVLGGYKSIR